MKRVKTKNSVAYIKKKKKLNNFTENSIFLSPPRCLNTTVLILVLYSTWGTRIVFLFHNSPILMIRTPAPASCKRVN